jgi:hypothetical protein
MFYIKSDLIFPTVFLNSPGFLGGNIGGFAQAGDDARAVIDFMHSHPVMAGYEAPVLCDGGTNPPSNLVDVSSKLQMPIQMTANTVREGTLTVTNLKGASASGTVTLKGINNKDGSVIPIVLSPSETTFGLAAGASKSWTVTFTGPKSGTTITWTATATAANDNNLTNDTASAITTVMSSRGKKGASKRSSLTRQSLR